MTPERIDALAEGFLTCTLPKEDWTHEAHLLVGLWHLHHYSFYEALLLMRCRIITYNLATGGVNSAQSGYHETLTEFWLRQLAEFRRSVGEEKSLSAQCNQLFASRFADRGLPFEYYSRELLFSVQARAKWTEPDLQTFQLLNFL